MSPTMTAFLLSCMCFASININVTNARTKLDLIFVADTASSNGTATALNTLMKNVSAEAQLLIGDLEDFKTAVIHAQNPPSVLIPLGQYNKTEFEALVDTIGQTTYGLAIPASLVNATNEFEGSEIYRADSCGSLQVLVLVAFSHFGLSMTDAQPIRDAGIVSIAVAIQISGSNLDVFRFLASGDTTSDERLHRINTITHFPPTTTGINEDIRRAVQAATCPCELNPCMNDGKCNNIGRTGNYWCECVDNYIGKNCQFCI